MNSGQLSNAAITPPTFTPICARMHARTSLFQTKMAPIANPVSETKIKYGPGQKNACGNTNKVVAPMTAKTGCAPSSIALEIMNPRKNSSSMTPARRKTIISHQTGAEAVWSRRSSVLCVSSPASEVITLNAATPHNASPNPTAAVDTVDAEGLRMPSEVNCLPSTKMTKAINNSAIAHQAASPTRIVGFANSNRVSEITVARQTTKNRIQSIRTGYHSLNCPPSYLR